MAHHDPENYNSKKIASLSIEMTQHTRRPPRACFCLYDTLQRYTWTKCLPCSERIRSTTEKWGRRKWWSWWCWIDGAALALKMVLAQIELQEGMQWVDMIVAVVQRISSTPYISGKVLDILPWFVRLWHREPWPEAGTGRPCFLSTSQVGRGTQDPG